MSDSQDKDINKQPGDSQEFDDSSNAMDQSGMDDLIASMAGDKVSPEVPSSETGNSGDIDDDLDAPLAQDDMDALIANIQGGETASASDDSAPPRAGSGTGLY